VVGSRIRFANHNGFSDVRKKENRHAKQVGRLKEKLRIQKKQQEDKRKIIGSGKLGVGKREEACIKKTPPGKKNGVRKR